MVQKYIHSPPRVLRVVTIGETFISYWRIADDPNSVKANLSNQGSIDHHSDPDIQKQAVSATQAFCDKTGIDLAGFDLLVETDSTHNNKLFFLEINYFFGRKGLGGSTRYYELLNAEVKKWLSGLKG